MSETSSLQSQNDRLYRRLLMHVAPVLLTSIDDSGPVQIAQIRINDTPELIDNVKVPQLYGISAVAPTDPQPSDALAVFITGQRSNGVIVATNNQQYRLQNQQPGETSLYTDEGDTIGLNRGNIINVKSKKTINVNGQDQVNVNTATNTINASSQIQQNTPLVNVTGDLKAKGIIDAAGGFFSNGLPIGGGAGEPGPPGPPGDPGPPGPPGPTAVSADKPNMATLGSDSLIFARDAPSDGNQYVRQNAAWAIATLGSGGITDAPNDAYAYMRHAAGWSSGGTLNAPLILAGDPTAALGAATKQMVDLKAPIASPAFSGAPTAPTPATADNSTRIATTAFVEAQGFVTGGPYAPIASPNFTGIPTAPTAPTHTANSQIATTAYTDAVTDLLAPLASPHFTGVPTAPTAPPATANTQIATTAYADAADDLLLPLAGGTLTGPIYFSNSIPNGTPDGLGTGRRLSLFQSGSGINFAFGIAASTLWAVVPVAGDWFSWFYGTVEGYRFNSGAQMHLYGNALGPAAENPYFVYAGGGLTITAPDNTSPGVAQIAWGGAPDFDVMRAQGTAAAPLAIDASRILGSFRGGGYDGTNWDYSKAAVMLISGAAWTPTSHSAAIRIYTTPVGSTTAASIAMFNTDGSFYVGSNTSAASNLTGPGTISCDNGITITTGGLTVNGGGASITGNATVSLMLTATTLQSTGNAIVGNNLTVNGSITQPLIFLNGAAANGPPDTLGTGERLRIYTPGGGPPTYALGIEAAGLWFGVPVNAHFSWYIGTTQIALWNASAGLTLNTGLTITAGGIIETGPAVFNGSATFNANVVITAAGIPTWTGTPAGPNQLTNKSYVDGQNALYLPLAGGTLTGQLTISGGTAVPGVGSAGERISLYPGTSGNPDYAIGISSGTMWFDVSLSSNQFAWYAGTAMIARLYGASSRLDLYGNAVNPGFGATVNGLNFAGGDGTTSIGATFTGYGGSPAIYMLRGEGTGAATTALQANTLIGGPRYGGYGGGAWNTSQVGLLAYTINNWTVADNSAQLRVYTTAAAASTWALRATFDVNFTITGAGYQPGGGSWTATSDPRLKKDVEPYTAGLPEVLQLDPIRFRYNGLGGIFDTETIYYGLDTEQALGVMPEMVHSLAMKLREEDPEPVDVLHLNSTALTFALVNAVKELAARLAVLERRVA
jgi:phage gp45-like